MSKIKNPLEKKHVSLIKDRYVPAEYPHAFRRQWPRKKKIATRQMRHTLNQLTHQTIAGGDLEAGEARFDKGFFNRRQKLFKSEIPNLAEHIERRLAFRVVRHAWNYFKKPYNPVTHREGFKRVIETLVNGKTPISAKQATWVRHWLMAEQVETTRIIHPKYFSWRSGRANWLASFFADEPAYRQLLQDWVESFDLETMG
ncbi:MAG TPA: hypothetical protein PLL06_07070 [Acidobacteriota bacterium]|nr:hypothetical protein [Acidobacteriota bacterium]